MSQFGCAAPRSARRSPCPICAPHQDGHLQKFRLQKAPNRRQTHSAAQKAQARVGSSGGQHPPGSVAGAAGAGARRQLQAPRPAAGERQLQLDVRDGDAQDADLERGNSIVQIDAAPFRAWYAQHYGIDLGKKTAAVEGGDGAGTEVHRSRSVLAKLASRQAKRQLERALEEQFQSGRLLACVRAGVGILREETGEAQEDQVREEGEKREAREERRLPYSGNRGGDSWASLSLSRILRWRILPSGLLFASKLSAEVTVDQSQQQQRHPDAVQEADAAAHGHGGDDQGAKHRRQALQHVKVDSQLSPHAVAADAAACARFTFERSADVVSAARRLQLEAHSAQRASGLSGGGKYGSCSTHEWSEGLSGAVADRCAGAFAGTASAASGSSAVVRNIFRGNALTRACRASSDSSSVSAIRISRMGRMPPARWEFAVSGRLDRRRSDGSGGRRGSRNRRRRPLPAPAPRLATAPEPRYAKRRVANMSSVSMHNTGKCLVEPSSSGPRLPLTLTSVPRHNPNGPPLSFSVDRSGALSRSVAAGTSGSARADDTTIAQLRATTASSVSVVFFYSHGPAIQSAHPLRVWRQRGARADPRAGQRRQDHHPVQNAGSGLATGTHAHGRLQPGDAAGGRAEAAVLGLGWARVHPAVLAFVFLPPRGGPICGGQRGHRTYGGGATRAAQYLTGAGAGERGGVGAGQQAGSRGCAQRGRRERSPAAERAAAHLDGDGHQRPER
eukprot:ctg_573.g265